MRSTSRESNRGDPSKLVVIIDEAQFVAKRDASFMEAVAKLKSTSCIRDLYL